MTPEDEERKAALDRSVNALIRAMNALHTHGSGLDQEAITAAGAVLQKEVRRLAKGKGRKRRQIFYVDSPQFDVALRYVGEEISYGEAKQLLCELCFCCGRTAEEHLKEMKPRAKSTLGAISRLKLMAHKPPREIDP